MKEKPARKRGFLLLLPRCVVICASVSPVVVVLRRAERKRRQFPQVSDIRHVQSEIHAETRLAWTRRLLTGRPLTDIGYRTSDPAFGGTQ